MNRTDLCINEIRGHFQVIKEVYTFFKCRVLTTELQGSLHYKIFYITLKNINSEVVGFKKNLLIYHRPICDLSM